MNIEYTLHDEWAQNELIIWIMYVPTYKLKSETTTTDINSKNRALLS